MEKLLEELDKWVNFTDPQTKTTRQVGLTIYYSPSRKRWEVGYGRKSQEKHVGIGQTVEEALQDKLNKLNS